MNGIYPYSYTQGQALEQRLLDALKRIDDLELAVLELDKRLEADEKLVDE